MTPQEVSIIVHHDFILALYNDGAWRTAAKPFLNSYDAFAGFTYPQVDRLAAYAEDGGMQKISYVKARTTTGLWELAGGSLSDSDYLAATRLVATRCRLPDDFAPLTPLVAGASELAAVRLELQGALARIDELQETLSRIARIATL